MAWCLDTLPLMCGDISENEHVSPLQVLCEQGTSTGAHDHPLSLKLRWVQSQVIQKLNVTLRLVRELSGQWHLLPSLRTGV